MHKPVNCFHTCSTVLFLIACSRPSSRVTNLEQLVDSTVSPVVDQEIVQAAAKTRSGRHRPLHVAGFEGEDMPATSSDDLDASISPPSERCRGPDLVEAGFDRKRRCLPVDYAHLHEGSSE